MSDSFGTILKVGGVALGASLLVLASIATHTPSSTSTDPAVAYHDACWYQMQYPARHSLGATDDATVSAAADRLCEEAKQLSRTSDLSRADAQVVIANLYRAVVPTPVTIAAPPRINPCMDKTVTNRDLIAECKRAAKR